MYEFLLYKKGGFTLMEQNRLWYVCFLFQINDFGIGDFFAGSA